MGVEGCTKCIKYMLFFFNFIFWVSRHSFCVYILIAVGAVMMFVGFLGCYGAIQESQCLLGTFFACLVILFACEVAAGIWGFMNKDKISKDLITFYDSVHDRGVSYTNPDQKQGATAVLKVFHETLSCCGKGGIDSVLNKLATDVCPERVKITEGCHSKIKELFSEKIYLIGIAALVVAVIMIFEMIFSMVLCCGIRNSPVY
ncbi:CD81 antigen [Triplophysa rosa]|uniref:Tetraspanin n=1 Tax=Triplophysa rosa TaxID=992332 RepID=A0A9W7X4B8_TRIRA|nr:CD81 antigen [Triplophysa rosa]